MPLGERLLACHSIRNEKKAETNMWSKNTA